MTITEKLAMVYENTTKVFQAGAMETIEVLCPPINETGSVVQCCPIQDLPLTITDIDNIAGTGFVTICGKNLYDPVKYPLVDGYYINKGSGVESGSGTHADYCATRTYIPVEHLRGMTINLNHLPGGSAPGMAFYDANFVRTDPSLNGKGGNQTVPDDAVYMKFCTYISKKDKVQIELGSVATSYEPYDEKRYMVADSSFVPLDVEPFEGINTIFAHDTHGADNYNAVSFTVTGTTDPKAEIKRLTDILTAMGGNVVSTTEEG